MQFSDPAAVDALAVARVTTDAAGAGVRALLGAGAASVILATRLSKASLPARPFLAYRPGPVPTVGGIDQHTPTWWLYDDPAQGDYRLSKLAFALIKAYDPIRWAAPPLPGAVGVVAVGALSEPFEDTNLGLRGRRLPLTIDA